MYVPFSHRRGSPLNNGSCLRRPHCLGGNQDVFIRFLSYFLLSDIPYGWWIYPVFMRAGNRTCVSDVSSPASTTVLPRNIPSYDRNASSWLAQPCHVLNMIAPLGIRRPATSDGVLSLLERYSTRHFECKDARMCEGITDSPALPKWSMSRTHPRVPGSETNPVASRISTEKSRDINFDSEVLQISLIS